MQSYQDLIDSLSDLVQDYGDGPELSGDYAARLYMVKRGKHYNEKEARQVLRGIARGLRDTARKLDAMAGPDNSNPAPFKVAEPVPGHMGGFEVRTRAGGLVAMMGHHPDKQNESKRYAYLIAKLMNQESRHDQ